MQSVYSAQSDTASTAAWDRGVEQGGIPELKPVGHSHQPTTVLT